MENEKAEGRVCNIRKDEGLKEEEEENMEKFFALIKSFHEARKRRRQELDELQEAEKSKIRRLSADGKSSWIPSFEWQDFTGEIVLRKPPLMFPGPLNKKEEAKKGQEDDSRTSLDLKLTL